MLLYRDGKTHQSSTEAFSETERDLMSTYYQALQGAGILNYTYELFEQHYMMNVVYFAIFCLREKFAKMTPKDVQRYKEEKADGLHLRCLNHMKLLLHRAHQLLDLLDWTLICKHDGLLGEPASMGQIISQLHPE